MPATLTPKKPATNPAAVAALEAACGLIAAAACERVATLTPRELEVLELMAWGMSNKEIAKQLGISPKTNDIHRANVKQKLGEGTVGVPRHWYLWKLSGGAGE